MNDKQAVARLFEDAEKVRAGIERDLPHILAKGFANLLNRNKIDYNITKPPLTP